MDAERRRFGEPGSEPTDESAAEGGASGPEPSLVARQAGSGGGRDRGEGDVNPVPVDRVDGAAATFGPGGPASPELPGVEAPGDDTDITGTDATDPGAARVP